MAQKFGPARGHAYPGPALPTPPLAPELRRRLRLSEAEIRAAKERERLRLRVQAWDLRVDVALPPDYYLG